jgi:ribosomal protein S18 acetylase RimI-like enzyme
MPENTVIRPAAPGEAAALLAVMRRAFAEYRGVLQPESSVFVETPDLIAEKLACGGGFIAVEGEKPVGCLIAEEKAGRGSPIGYLGRLAVDPSLRRQGLAWRLMLAGEGFARDRGLKIAEVQVRIALPGNIALFQSLGYRETARRAHPGFTEPTYLVMEKSLE